MGLRRRAEGCRCSTVLFCAWLAWSRFRVVLPLWDRPMVSVVMALDRALQRFGGAPTYALTDNERTVSIDHVCGLAVRNPRIVSVGRHHGLTIATCVPADPQSGGWFVRPLPRDERSSPRTMTTRSLRTSGRRARRSLVRRGGARFGGVGGLARSPALDAP